MTRSEAFGWLIAAVEEGMRNCESDANNGCDGAQYTYDAYCEAWGFLDEFRNDLGV